MTTNQIEVALMYHFGRNTDKTMLNNVTNMHRCLDFETDMLLLSGNNYATGFEIKISKSDLKNDLKKCQYTGYKNCYMEKTAIDHYRHFKYFNYAVPEKLVEETLNTIHDFCGVYAFYKDEKYKLLQYKEIRKPILLNNYKWSEKEVNNIYRLSTFRIYGLMRKNLMLQNKINTLLDNMT